MVQRTEEPHDRLTRMCESMTDAFDAHPEHQEEDKCIVFLNDGKLGGIVLHGYGLEGDIDAIADLFIHLKAMFKANGKELLIAPIGGVG